MKISKCIFKGLTERNDLYKVQHRQRISASKYNSKCALKSKARLFFVQSDLHIFNVIRCVTNHFGNMEHTKDPHKRRTSQNQDNARQISVFLVLHIIIEYLMRNTYNFHRYGENERFISCICTNFAIYMH